MTAPGVEEWRSSMASVATPGPWMVEAVDERSAGHFQLVTFDAALTYQRHGGDAIDEENEANRLLIEAAPDLLEACEGIWELLRDATWRAPFNTELEAPLQDAAVQLEHVIAKARGLAVTA